MCNWSLELIFKAKQVFCYWSVELTFKAKLFCLSPKAKIKTNTAKQPFWKRCRWKSYGFYPHRDMVYTHVHVYCATGAWSYYCKPNLSQESGNHKILYGHQTAILEGTLLKINRLLPMATINMHMNFGIESPEQTWLTLRKPCCLQTDGGTMWIQYTYLQLRWAGV